MRRKSYILCSMYPYHSQFIKIRQGFIFYTYTLYVISSSNVLKQFVYDKKIVSINACVCVYGCGVGGRGLYEDQVGDKPQVCVSS